MAFGLSYAIVPFVSAWVSWRLVRATRPRLILWSLLFTSVGALGGQLFFVTESLLSIHAVWPLVFTLATGLSPRRWVLSLAITAVLFELHPVSGPLLVFAAVVAGARAIREPRQRNSLLVAAILLFACGGARIVQSLHDPYEVSQAAVNLRGIWRSLKLPALGVAAAGCVTVSLAAAHFTRGTRSRSLHALLLALLVLVAVSFFPWARDARAWQDELNFRFIAPFVALPFLACAGVFAVFGKASDERLTGSDGWVAFGGVLVFALVLTTQSAVWLELRRSLEATFARSGPCISMGGVPDCRRTALKWWPTPSYALLIQGRAPRTLLLPGNDCARPDLDRVIPVNPWYARPRDVGWFDLRRTGLR
jgi:hypothetical protein